MCVRARMLHEIDESRYSHEIVCSQVTIRYNHVRVFAGHVTQRVHRQAEPAACDARGGPLADRRRCAGVVLDAAGAVLSRARLPARRGVRGDEPHAAPSQVGQRGGLPQAGQKKNFAVIQHLSRHHDDTAHQESSP